MHLTNVSQEEADAESPGIFLINLCLGWKHEEEIPFIYKQDIEDKWLRE